MGTSVTDLVPYGDLAKLIVDSKAEPVKVVEVHPSPEQEIQLARILKITIVRLPPGPFVHQKRRVHGPPCGPGSPFRLLLFEDVSERVILEDQLAQTEKIFGMGQLAAGIAHELANPLSSMSSNLQYVWEKLEGGGDRSLISAIEVTLEHVDQMRRLLHTLLDFTGQHRPHYAATDVQDLIRRKLAFVAKEAEKRRVEVSVSFAPSLAPCQLDARSVGQVLLNLLKNSFEAMPNGGRLSIRTRAGYSAPCGGDAAVIEIEDTGEGIEEAELRRVFRPLYSTKPKGTGLGLPFCRQVVEEHGGEIRLTSQKGSGTTVTLLFPLRQEDAMAE
jgi:two-component system sensor histidine kinase HydH